MKTAVVIYEGMGDRPHRALDQRTPMETARCSIATDMAVTGHGGMIRVPRIEANRRNEVILAQYIGCPREMAETLWRGPLEALAAGVACASGDWVFRADYGTLDGDRLTAASVPRLSMEETVSLTESIQQAWEGTAVSVHPVEEAGCALVVVHKGAHEGAHGFAPHGVEGEDLSVLFGRSGPRSFLRTFAERSREVLTGHSVNDVRLDLGENPANLLWPWGGGPALSADSGTHKLEGALATNARWARGLAFYVGMETLDVRVPWTDSESHQAPFSVADLIEALRRQDRLFVYITSRQAGGRYGSAADKVWSLEALDHALLAPLHTVLAAWRPYRIALCVDGAVFTASGGTGGDELPFIVSGAGIEPDGVGHWDERSCARGALGRIAPDQLLDVVRKE